MEESDRSRKNSKIKKRERKEDQLLGEEKTGLTNKRMKVRGERDGNVTAGMER